MCNTSRQSGRSYLVWVLDGYSSDVLSMLLFLALVCFVGFSHCLLEKEIGKHEVYFQNVGFARDAHFFVSPQRKRTVITSEGGTLASLMSKTGAIGTHELI